MLSCGCKWALGVEMGCSEAVEPWSGAGVEDGMCHDRALYQ